MSLEEIDEDYVLSAKSVQISYDAQNTNEWWIQVYVSQPNTVSSIQFSTSSLSLTLSSPSWDSTRQYFIGKPSSEISFGTSTKLVLNLSQGGSVSLDLSYSKGQSKTISIQDSGNSGNQGSNTTKQSSKSPRIQKFIKEVGKYKESGSYTTGIKGEDSLLRKNKEKLLSAITSAGIEDTKAKAFLFSVFTVESEQMYNSNGEAQRDASKDGTLSENVSPCNMNKDMLVNYVKYKGNIRELNKLSNIKKTLDVVIDSVNKLGIYGFLNFHRGGRTGYSNPKKYDGKFQMSKFRIGVYNIMLKYIQDQTLFNDGRKVWADIPYV